MTENEISGIVVKYAIELHHQLGPGLLEHVYSECLYYKLTRSGLFVEKEKPIPLVYEDVKLDCGFRLDLLVGKKVVIEVKSVEALNEIILLRLLHTCDLEISGLDYS